MKRLLVLVVILVACAAGLGFYRGWFRLSTESSDHEAGVTITVDRDQIRGDEERVKESAREIGDKKEKAADESPPPGGRHEGP